MNHYNGNALIVPKGEPWQKVFGPYLLYFNSDPAGGDACWADAKRQSVAEREAWPYSWMGGVNGYPLKYDRGSVAGRLTIKDPLKPTLTGAKAWVGLAQPDPGGNWQFESKHYQYWERASADGSFVIPHVRPGTYALYAFTAGALGEFSRTNVVVKAGDPTMVEELVWNVPHPGAKIAWEIGVPDRSAKEFRHGDDYFQALLWDKFPGEFRNPLEYTVGVSDWSKDWNYVHCGYPLGTNWTAWKWRIHFQLPTVPSSGDATLTLAYASSYWGRTEVYVNDENKLHQVVRPAVDGGNALIREGIHAKYCVEHVAIPVSMLRQGANTITLVQGQNRFDRPFYHVMYDYLNLELPER
jgi:rhamnogalacturonan endolyase